MKGQLQLIHFLRIRLEMIITSSFRKRLEFGEIGEGKWGPEERDLRRPLPLLQSHQEIWKVQNFLIRDSQRSQLDRCQRFFSILDLTYVLESK